jgi:2,4-dienoyl-CoA reductase-like NADH-dependent reductase (Old Yellow Enzyme family)
MTKPETNLFTPHRLQGMELRNRLIRSATLEGMCGRDGLPTAALVDLYRRLAAGGCGLLISGITYVSEEGRLIPTGLGAACDAQLAGLKALAAAIHEEGGRFCLQLGHTGGQGRSTVCGQQPVAPSAVKLEQYPEMPREMTLAEIATSVAAFAAAAGRAKRAGCDAVQLHAAHGYLINQFLSPLTNQRQDGYGGDLAGRSRFLLETVAAVRQAVGVDFPLLVKLNGSDNLTGGLEIDESLAVAKLLDAAGIAGIEISSGTPASGDRVPIRLGHEKGDEMAYNVVLSRLIKQHVTCPVIAVGGIRSLHVATGLLRTNQADYLSLSRPLIREPDLPNKLQSGASDKSTCISCNGCLKAMLKGDLRCVVPHTS